MSSRRPIFLCGFTAFALLFVEACFSSPVQAQVKACSLATPDELQAVLGGKVTFSGNAASPKICMGQAPTARVLLRIAKREGDAAGATEAKGLEIAKEMGAQIEVKTFGPITCSTSIPPPNLAQYGYNTTCAILNNGKVAAIEVTAKAQKDMVPIDKLRPLAEKMATRF